jgi:hypothetical protein
MYEHPLTSPPFQLPLDLALLSHDTQAEAMEELRGFVTTMASDTKDGIGFGWVPMAIDHPSCHELNRRVAGAVAQRTPLPIPSRSANRTLLGDRDAELALRYWRSVVKFRQSSCTCDAASEYDCDIALVDAAVLAGVSHAAQLYLYGILIGDTTLRLAGFGLAVDPAAYSLDVLMFGLAEAVVLEATRRREAAPSAA